MDLVHKANLFVASSRLQAVATGLCELASGEPSGAAPLDFNWAGDLFDTMDLSHNAHHPELIILATELRPLLYRRNEPLKVSSITNTLYRISSGQLVPTQDLEQAHRVVQRMSSDILTRLQYGYYRQAG
jgi:hypothetical protein